MDERLTPFEDKMKKSYHNLIEELGTVRAGRANPHVLDKIKVDYYGTPTSLQQREHRQRNHSLPAGPGPHGRGHGRRLPPDLRGIGGGIYHHGAHLLQGPVLPRQEDPVPAPAVSRGAPCGSADLRQ